MEIKNIKAIIINGIKDKYSDKTKNIIKDIGALGFFKHYSKIKHISISEAKKDTELNTEYYIWDNNIPIYVLPYTVNFLYTSENKKLWIKIIRRYISK